MIKHPKQSLHKMLILAGILFLGIVVRVMGLQDAIWSNVGYDETRDTLVADHIVSYGEMITRGPNTSNPYLANPPTYYYLLSVVWFFTRSIYGLKISWLLLSLIGLYLAYKLGSILADDALGYIFAFLLAIHPISIVTSQQISAPYLLPIIVLACVVFLVSPPTMISLSAFVIFVSLGIHIHPSMFVIFPILLVWWVIRYVSYWKQSSGLRTYVPLITACVMIDTWLFLSYRTIIFDQLDFASRNSISWSHILSQSSSALSLWVELILYTRVGTEATQLFLMTILYIVLFFACFRIIGKTSDKKSSAVFLCSLCVVPLVLISRYPGLIVNAYLMAALPYVFLMVAAGIRYAYRHSPPMAIFLLVLISAYYLRADSEFLPSGSRQTYFDRMGDIATHILADYRKIPAKTKPGNTYDFTLQFITPMPGNETDIWQTGGIWYQLEHRTHSRLVTLTNSGSNFVPRVTAPHYTYLICDQRIFDTFASSPDSTCDTLRNKIESMYATGTVLVYERPPYSLWRADAGLPH